MRLLLAGFEEEPLTVYTDGFRAYDPLEEDENYERTAVIHDEGEYDDWETLHSEEIIVDDDSGGVPHQHAARIHIAHTPEE